jgi:tetratricopeptide (TPR) repeat protein
MSRRAAKGKRHGPAGPTSGQLRAIDRLLDAGDDGEALARLRRLAVSYPRHGGIRGRLTEAAEKAQGTGVAAAAALDWCEVSPNSVNALGAAIGYCLDLGRPALADHLAFRLRELGGETPGLPLEEAIWEAICRQPDGSLIGRQQLISFDRGLTYLEGGAYRQALDALAGNPFIPARNNYALALFHSGDAEAALAHFLDSLAGSPENLYALAWVFQLRLFLGDGQGAAEEVEALARAVPQRLYDALAQVSALLLMGKDREAWAAFEKGRRQDWFEETSPGERARLLHLGASAAARRGREKMADKLWHEALKLAPDLAEARENRAELRRKPAERRGVWVHGFDQLIPMSWLEQARSFSPRSAAAAEGRLGALFAPVSDSYLRGLYTVSDGVAQRLSRLLLLERAAEGDAQAAGILREMLTLPRGLMDDRMEILMGLTKAGLIGTGEAIEVWDGERLTSAVSVRQRIDRGPSDSGLPAAWDAKLEEAIHAFRRKDMETAEGLLKALVERFPTHPTALGNLAAVHSARGEGEQAEVLLRRSVEADPDYLFGRCNLARLLLLRGDTEEAEALLDGLERRETLHVQEAFALYGTQAMLYKAKGDGQAAERSLRALEEMVEYEDEQREYENLRGLVERVGSPLGRVYRGLKALARKRAESTV